MPSAPEPVRVFRSVAHARAEYHIVAALSRGDRLVVVAGPRGIGKSTLARSVANGMLSGRAVLIQAGRGVSAAVLFENLLAACGVLAPEGDAMGASPAPELAGLRGDFLASLAALCPPVVVVDDAHELTAEACDALRQLAEMEGRDGRAPRQAVLLGEPGVGRLVEQTSLGRLAGGGVEAATLGPLERDELGPYVRQRLSDTGGEPLALDRAALFRIADASGGVPAAVNDLCERIRAGADRGSSELGTDVAIAPRLGASGSRVWRTVLVVLAVALLLLGAAAAYVSRSGAAGSSSAGPRPVQNRGRAVNLAPDPLFP